MPTSNLSRRGLIATAAAAAAAAAAVAATDQTVAAEQQADAVSASQGRIKQGVCYWCYRKKMSLEEMCTVASSLGLVGIDLMEPQDFPVLKQHGLIATMTKSHKLADGLCEPKFHDECFEKINAAIEATAAEGWKNVICFSGNRRGIDPETGMKNCVTALKKIIPVAEKAGVTLQMELLNSKVNHKDYLCDNSAWGVELVNASEATTSSCSTTSITCKSWKATSSERFRRTTSTSATTTPAATPAATSWTSRRNCSIRRSPQPSPTPGSRAFTAMNSSRRETRLRDSPTRSDRALFDRWIWTLPRGPWSKRLPKDGTGSRWPKAAPAG